MRYILACLLTLAFGAVSYASHAAAAPLAGSWSGGGMVRAKSGKKERVRCRVRYSKRRGKAYGVTATCATVSAGTIRQTGKVVKQKGNRYSGRMYTRKRKSAGRINVTVKGRRQTVTVAGSKGSWRLSLRKR